MMLIFSMKLLQDWYGVCSLFHGGSRFVNMEQKQRRQRRRG